MKQKSLWIFICIFLLLGISVITYLFFRGKPYYQRNFFLKFEGKTKAVPVYDEKGNILDSAWVGIEYNPVVVNNTQYYNLSIVCNRIFSFIYVLPLRASKNHPEKIYYLDLTKKNLLVNKESLFVDFSQQVFNNDIQDKPSFRCIKKYYDDKYRDTIYVLEGKPLDRVDYQFINLLISQNYGVVGVESHYLKRGQWLE